MGIYMREVVICADSTCDLPDYIVQQKDIVITPLSILLGENSYLDGVEICPQDIYAYVKKTGILPKTAAVPPKTYYDLFKRLTDAGKAVVHIGLSSAISSSFQNATVAAADFDSVYCIDSKSLCTAMGLLVLKACDFRDAGMDAKRIAAKTARLVPKVSTTFVLDNLEYLYKGGRCSGVARFGANVLGIRPSIGMTAEGTLEVAKKYRGKLDMVYRQYISDCLANPHKIDLSRIVIADSGSVSPDTIAFAKGLIAGKASFGEMITATAGCTISSHCGPGTLAIFYIKK